MNLSVWIVTEVPTSAVHFVVAGSLDRARDLVARRARIPPKSLSVVCLYEERAAGSERRPGTPNFERYLGPLERFSPRLRDDCDFCRGTGKVVGSRPVETCPYCGGSGMKTKRRS